jgi:four helix bundle protein
MKTHKDLDVWKNSIDLVTSIYKITNNFPKSEIYSLTNQIRRCAISIPSNIAEGAGRSHNKEYVQFLYISLGSLSELETQLIISNNIEYLSENNLQVLNEKIIYIRAQLIGLIKYLKNK